MFRVLLALVALTAIAGCSVSRAANKTGVELRTAASCQKLSCLQALPTSELVEKTEIDDDSGENAYVFRMQRRQGSTGRAVFHAGADVLTLGLWEVVGTPAEGAIQNNKQFVVRAQCSPQTDVCSLVDVVGYNEQTGQIEENTAITAPALTH